MNRVFVSPSTVDRVLARNGLVLAGNPRPARTTKKAWPDWVQWHPNQLWCWDATHFMRCESQIVYGIVDIVSKKWITTLLCAEATSVQVKVVFLNALQAEGLLDDLHWRLDQPDDVDLTDETAPVLLAVSDNGPEMRSDTTRTFMALMTIGQHFGRPSTPTDQAWIETLWGHIKAEKPHLLTIKDPAVLAVELERVSSDTPQYELDTYPTNNKSLIPNSATRHRAGEPISSATAEATVDTRSYPNAWSNDNT